MKTCEKSGSEVAWTATKQNPECDWKAISNIVNGLAGYDDLTTRVHYSTYDTTMIIG